MALKTCKKTVFQEDKRISEAEGQTLLTESAFLADRSIKVHQQTINTTKYNRAEM